MLTIGEILKSERQNQNLTLDKIENITKIRKKNLQAVENNDWKQFHSKIYIIGVIKSYGNFLGINQEKLLAIFRREYEKKEELKFKNSFKKSYFTPSQSFFRILIFFLVFIFLSYFAYQLILYFSPPYIKIVSPQETVFKQKSKITLIGKTEKESIIMINNERVYQNKDNTFKITIPLTLSKNEVIIEVTGSNGKKTILKKIFKKI